MTDVKEVTLVGEGGAETTFVLPLSEVFAEQVANGKLRAVDDDAEKALIDAGYLEQPVRATKPAKPEKP